MEMLKVSSPTSWVFLLHRRCVRARRDPQRRSCSGGSVQQQQRAAGHGRQARSSVRQAEQRRQWRTVRKKAKRRKKIRNK